jgi:hypothetical protein
MTATSTHSSQYRKETDQNMNDLLEFVLHAHGGLERWSRVRRLTTHLAVRGPFWGLTVAVNPSMRCLYDPQMLQAVRGLKTDSACQRRMELREFPDALVEETLTVDVRRQHAVFTPWITEDQSLTFDVEPERVTLQTVSGRILNSRTNPRSTCGSYDIFAPWDALQFGYLFSYGMWNYLTIPFLFTYPCVQTRELEPWDEDGQTWRRLHVTFPATIATHTAEQVFHYGPDGLLRRHDFTVEVNANALAVEYTDQHQSFDGLIFPTRCIVYRRKLDGTPDRSVTAFSVDIHDITIA